MCVLRTRLSSVTEGLWETKSHMYKAHTYSASTVTKAQLSGDKAPRAAEAGPTPDGTREVSARLLPPEPDHATRLQYSSPDSPYLELGPIQLSKVI